MGRLLNIWRSWSVARRLALVGGLVAVVAGAAVAAYLVTRRPADVSNPTAAFHKQKRVKKKPETLNWPMYGYDPARTRYLPVKGLDPPFGASLWSFQAGKLLEFQPIVVHGTIYFMDKDGTFYALNVHGGHVEWKRKIGTLNASSPAYWNGRLFAVNLEPQQAVALNAKKKGKVLWRTPLPGRSESSPLVHNGKVIFGCESGDIFALDEKTGKVRWKVHTGGAVKGALALDHGTLFADNYAGEVWAIDAGNGHVKWTAHTQGGGFLHGGGVYSTPAVAFGRVYLGGLDGRVYSFVEKTGAARLEPLDGRRGLLLARRRGHAACAADRLHRLRGQALLRPRRQDRRGSLGALHQRDHSRLAQRRGPDRLRVGDRSQHRHLRLRRQQGPGGLQQQRGRVQPGHLGRQEDLPDRHLDHPGVQAPDQGRAETPAPSQAHEGGEPEEARLEAPRRQGQRARRRSTRAAARRKTAASRATPATGQPRHRRGVRNTPPEAAASRSGPLRVERHCRAACDERSSRDASGSAALRTGMPASRRWSFAWWTV